MGRLNGWATEAPMHRKGRLAASKRADGTHPQEGATKGQQRCQKWAALRRCEKMGGWAALRRCVKLAGWQCMAL